MKKISSRTLPVMAFAALAILVLFAACGGDDDDAAAGDGRLRVVADVPPITSIVENIGGDRIELRGMVPRGVSSHGYEPPPGDVRHLVEADLLIFNGLFLADPLYNLAEANMSDGATLVYLGEVAITRDEWIFDFEFAEEDGEPNPHVWMDPMRALRYAEIVHDELVDADPENAEYYSANLDAFEARIMDLHSRTEEAVATIPEQHRKLLTYHDCCPYMAERYDFEVIAAVQPSDFGEPSAREVAQIIDQVRELDLPAIFGSELFPSPVMEQIASETGAAFVFGIEDDSLPGDPGDPEHTYFGMMLENMLMVVPALGGSTEPLEGFDPSPVFEGESTAAY